MGSNPPTVCNLRLFLIGLRVWLSRGCRAIPEERTTVTYPAAVKYTLTVGLMSAGALILLVRILPPPMTAAGRIIWTALLMGLLGYGVLAILRDLRNFAKQRCADGRRWLAQQADKSQINQDAKRSQLPSRNAGAWK